MLLYGYSHLRLQKNEFAVTLKRRFKMKNNIFEMTTLVYQNLEEKGLIKRDYINKYIREKLKFRECSEELCSLSVLVQFYIRTEIEKFIILENDNLNELDVEETTLYFITQLFLDKILK